MRPRHVPILRRLALACALPALGLGAGAASGSPEHILITAPSGAPGAPGLPAQLAGWRQDGLVSFAILLDSTQDKGAPFGSLAVLDFPDEASLAQWQRVAAPSLGAGLIVTRADALAHGEKTPRDSSRATFLVALYDVLAPAARYREYVEGYVVPQMEAWKAARNITSYTLFAARPGSGAPWQSLLLMEYPDSLAYSQRDAVKDSTRAKLAADSAWKGFSDAKAAFRTEKSLTPAVLAELPAPSLSDLPPYRKEFNVVGGLRIVGSELKGNMDPLIEGFRKFHPDAVVSANYMTSSEGAIAGLYFGVSDIAPMGDDAKITDMMPFYDALHYCPTEISVGTGGYEKRGSLWALAIVVNKDNPITRLSLRQIECIFGSERTGGWEIGPAADNNLLYTAKYARSAASNIRTWDQLGLTGEFAGKQIQTYGYVAPGFAIAFERKLFHWSKKYNPNFKEFVEAKEATDDADGRAVSSDRMLEELSKDKWGIAWAALMHVKDYPNVKVLSISETDDGPAIPLTPETVANRTYPLIRDAYIYVNRPPGRPLDPRVREFLRFVLSREGQEILAKVGFYYPLTPECLREQLKKLD
jgi:phosphate transport system substrate-binding protein